MQDSDRILKRIEEFSNSEAEALSEIDAMVWCLINGKKFIKYGSVVRPMPRIGGCSGGEGRFWYVWCECGQYSTTCVRKYTRSRDAIKAIRPDGFKILEFNIGWSGMGNTEWFKVVNSGFNKINTDGSIIRKTFYSPHLKTEELAELHVTIQAISWIKIQREQADE